MTGINEDFKAFLAQHAQEAAGHKTARQAAYEQQERQAAAGAELFTGLFADLDANSHQEPAPADPAEEAFNRTFGL